VRVPYLRETGVVVGLSALIAWSIFMYRMGGHGCRADTAEQVAAYAKQVEHATGVARRIEQEKAADIAAIAERYEQDKRDAKAVQDAVVAGLRSGNVKLRTRWQGCEATARVASAAASVAESAAAARDREESAARVVRAARDADDQIRRLQEVLKADRGTK
jgi:hypothetical protein